MPIIGNVRCRRIVLDQLGRVDLEICAEYIRAVKVRRSPRTAQILGVVAGKEDADVALLVERVAVGVAGAKLVVIREALFNVRFEGIIR